MNPNWISTIITFGSNECSQLSCIDRLVYPSENSLYRGIEVDIY